jgi:hypothetical protein
MGVSRWVFGLLFCALWFSPETSHGVDRFVKPAGQDSGSCSSIQYACKTIQYALDRASEEDVIKVAQGIYNENIVIPSQLRRKDLLIQGGWNGAFTSRSDDPSVTIIDGGQVAPVIGIEDLEFNQQSLTIENFTIQHGKGLDGKAGGVYCLSSGHGHSLTLKNNIVAANSGDKSAVGFVALNGSASVTLIGNRIFSNDPGGLMIYSQNGATGVTLVNNIVAKNDQPSDAGPGEDGILLSTYGGGSLEASIVNNTIVDDGIAIKIWTLFGTSSSINAEIINTIIDGVLATDYLIGHTPPHHVVVNVSYSIVGSTTGQGIYLGEQVSASSPLFVNPAADDYRLLYDSPGVDQGICGQGPQRIAPYQDFEGEGRPGYGQEFGCDIGADEYVFVPMLPLPTGQQGYQYGEAVWPTETDDPSTCHPISSGEPSSSGVLNFQLALPKFEAPVDVYVGFFAPLIDQETIFLVQPDRTLAPHSQGIVPWKSNVATAIKESVISMVPISGLPVGTYYAYLLAAPVGTMDRYYLWTHTFEVPETTF